jgi:ribonuclease D
MKDQEEEELAELLCDWREHIAKMKDINPDEVISYETLSNLIKTKVTSILQISELCSSHSQHLIYSLSL